MVLNDASVDGTDGKVYMKNIIAKPSYKKNEVKSLF